MSFAILWPGTVCDTTTMQTTSTQSTSIGSTPCATFTVLGNSNGAMCVFPFIYLNQVQYECITLNSGGVLWCATTNNYDRDQLWGNCQGKLAHFD